MIYKYLLLLLFLGLPLSTPNPQDVVDQTLMEMTPEQFLEFYLRWEQEGPQTVYIYEQPKRYQWTVEDIHYTAFMAQHEAWILGEIGMISVISTAYERTVSPRWCEDVYCSKSITEELLRPGQFSPMRDSFRQGRMKADYPEAYLAVYKYILGLYDPSSGCIGYEFFNSLPNKPAMCRIQTLAGFMNFFSTQEFIRLQEKGEYRNVQ